MTTLAPLVHSYVAGRQRRGEIDKSTIDGYRSTLSVLAVAHGNRPLSQVGRHTIERWLETRFVTAPDGSRQPMAASSKRTQWSQVSKFMDWLVDEGHIRRNPCRELDKPRQPKTEPRALDGDAIDALLAAVPDARARALVAFEYGLGGRRVEAHRANVEHWSRRNAEIHLYGKGHNERIVPVTEFERHLFDAYLAEYPTTTGPLFRSYTTGRRLSVSTIGHSMCDWMYDAGIKHAPRDGVSGHALRHTSAADLLDATDDLVCVQEFLGHSDLSTTAKYLRRTRAGKMRDGMEGRGYRLSGLGVAS